MNNSDIIPVHVRQDGDIHLSREQVKQIGLYAGDQLILLPSSNNQFLLLKVDRPEPVPKEELSSKMRQTFHANGYDTREKVLELIRDVKQEMVQE